MKNTIDARIARLDTATKLVTAFQSYSGLLGQCLDGYVPTLHPRATATGPVTHTVLAGGREAAIELLRDQLVKDGFAVWPAHPAMTPQWYADNGSPEERAEVAARNRSL